MNSTLVLDQDYNYQQFRYSGNALSIDAQNASWIVSNMGSQLNLYPVLVEDLGDGAHIFGGTITGEVSLTLDWVDAYVNSAALLVRDSYAPTVSDWSISQAWDGIRIGGSSEDFLIENVWMTDIRDDAIESDDGNSGTIRNSFFDGVFCGISLADSETENSSHKTVTIDNVLIKMETYDYKGELTHCSPIKVEETSPSLKINDSVFAITDVDHIRMHKTQMIWDKTIDASGNYYLNLSDEPFPSDYPLPGTGWTVLEGQEAWDHWNAAQATWTGADDTVSTTDNSDLNPVDPDTGIDASTVDDPAPEVTTVDPVSPVVDEVEVATDDPAPVPEAETVNLFSDNIEPAIDGPTGGTTDVVSDDTVEDPVPSTSEDLSESVEESVTTVYFQPVLVVDVLNVEYDPVVPTDPDQDSVPSEEDSQEIVLAIESTDPAPDTTDAIEVISESDTDFVKPIKGKNKWWELDEAGGRGKKKKNDSELDEDLDAMATDISLVEPILEDSFIYTELG